MPFDLWCDIDRFHRRGRPIGSFCWEIATMIVPVALGIVLVGVLVVVITGRVRVASTLVLLIPDRVEHWFHTTTVAPPGLPEGVKEGAMRAAPAPIPSVEAAGGFALGSSEDTVRAVQGRPTRIEGSAWYYGDSEIRFAAGRVISWKNSSRNPLKIR